MPTGLSVQVADIMTGDVAVVTADMTVEAAARLLTSRSVSGMPVVDEHEHLVGIISEFDIIARDGQTVGDIMTKEVISVSEADDAATIAQILTSHRVRRVPVLRDGHVVGIVSRSDLVRLFALTRWSCESCGFYTRGFERLTVCPKCGNETIVLEREPPGM